MFGTLDGCAYSRSSLSPFSLWPFLVPTQEVPYVSTSFCHRVSLLVPGMVRAGGQMRGVMDGDQCEGRSSGLTYVFGRLCPGNYLRFMSRQQA